MTLNFFHKLIEKMRGEDEDMDNEEEALEDAEEMEHKFEDLQRKADQNQHRLRVLLGRQNMQRRTNLE